MISNKLEDIAGLPRRAKSSLQALPIKFKGYGVEVAKKILTERVEKVFSMVRLRRGLSTGWLRLLLRSGIYGFALTFSLPLDFW